MSAFPVLPYNGSSGWSGTDTSRRAARILDLAGVTAQTQRDVFEVLAHAGEHGATVAEIRAIARFPHHGRVSGALSVLHKRGLVARLVERRDGCRVYVIPKYVGERPADQQAKRKHTCPDCGATF